jgi:hypothetical protein
MLSICLSKGKLLRIQDQPRPMSRFLVCVIWLAMARAMPSWPPVAFSPTIGNFLVGGHGGPPSSASPHTLSSIHRKPLPGIRRGTSFPLLSLEEPVENMDSFATTSSEPQCMQLISGLPILDSPSTVNENRQRSPNAEPNPDDILPEYDQILSGESYFQIIACTRKETPCQQKCQHEGPTWTLYACCFLEQRFVDDLCFQVACQTALGIQFCPTSCPRIAFMQTWQCSLGGKKQTHTHTHLCGSAMQRMNHALLASRTLPGTIVPCIKNQKKNLAPLVAGGDLARTVSKSQSYVCSLLYVAASMRTKISRA